MGVDVASIIPIAEDTFGFSIPAEDAAGIDGVDGLHKYVLARRFRGYQEDCLARVTSYKLKRGMMLAMRIPRQLIGESSQLSELIPKHRRRVWRTLQQETGLRLPQLSRSVWVKRIVAAATVALGIAVPVMLSLPLLGGAIITAIVTMIALGNLFVWLTKPLAFGFHTDCKTMEQLALLTLALNYRLIARELNATISDDEVRRQLLAAIGGKSGVRTGRRGEKSDQHEYRHAV